MKPFWPRSQQSQKRFKRPSRTFNRKRQSHRVRNYFQQRKRNKNRRTTQRSNIVSQYFVSQYGDYSSRRQVMTKQHLTWSAHRTRPISNQLRCSLRSKRKSPRPSPALRMQYNMRSRAANRRRTYRQRRSSSLKMSNETNKPRTVSSPHPWRLFLSIGNRCPPMLRYALFREMNAQCIFIKLTLAIGYGCAKIRTAARIRSGGIRLTSELSKSTDGLDQSVSARFRHQQ